MEIEEPRTPHSFVARFWVESEQEGIPLWRGHVRHVQGDQEIHFKKLNELCSFIEHVCGFTGLATQLTLETKNPID